MSPVSNHDQSISVTFESIRDFNLKMIDMAHANMEAFFGLTRQLATGKAPSEIAELWTAHCRKQFETLTEQTKELTALGQKTAAESAEPIARSVNQAFLLIGASVRGSNTAGFVIKPAAQVRASNAVEGSPAAF